ncbi:unnamed protein product [Absidia cylindrospora]
MNTETNIEFGRAFEQEEEEDKQVTNKNDTDTQATEPITISRLPDHAPICVLNIPDEDDDEVGDNNIVKETVTKHPDGSITISTIRSIVFTKSSDGPFGIVLVNIKKAAEERYIHCEKKWLDGETPYVALSYRWGELDEQMVAATEDYHARIVSFQLDDFFKLCQAIQQEPSLKHIEYVWVDALCVDQENIEKRKATIYHMNEIYTYATHIVAVPDLHASHLSTCTTANRDVMDLIKKYRRYLYYLLDNSADAEQCLQEMDHAWMDSLGIPTLDLYRRDFMNDHTMARQQNNSSPSDDNQPCFIQQMMTLMFHRFSEDKVDHDQQLSCRLMVEFQRLEWQRQLEQRKNEITQSIKFLQSVMEDWSNRAWVISEYHLSRQRHGDIKFWFNQLTSPELHGYRFFSYSFDRRNRNSQSIYETILRGREGHSKTQDDDYDSLVQHQHRPYKSQMVALKNQFHDGMRRQLNSRTALEMILQSKASRCEDRLHSILPLVPRYKHLIKDKQSVSSLGVSDLLSVRLQLLRWLDTKDQLNLLFCAHHPTTAAKVVPLLPTFATNLKTIKPGLLKLLSQHHDTNFDLDDPDSVRLAERDEGNGTLNHILWLRPKGYYVRCPQRSIERHFYDEIGTTTTTTTSKMWKDVGLDPVKDTLDAVSIPLFMSKWQRDGKDDDDDDDDFDDPMDDDLGKHGKLRSNLQLVGSWRKMHGFFIGFALITKTIKYIPDVLVAWISIQMDSVFIRFVM